MKKYILFSFLMIIGGLVFSQNIQIGVVTDFDRGPKLDSLLQVLAYEVDQALGTSKKASLNVDQVVYGVLNLNQAQSGYNSVLSNSDLVILIGGISVKGAVVLNEFSKPTIGIGIIDPLLQGIPYANGTSGVPNFTYIRSTQELTKELQYFKYLFPFEKLGILTNLNTAVTVDEGKGLSYIDSLAALLSCEIELIPVGKNVASSFEGFSEDIDAVYLSMLDGKTTEDISQIGDFLKTRKLPSFSGSKWHVDLGILASIGDENDFQQVARKIAIMADEAISGEVMSDMQVAINFKEDFHLNIETAERIGFYPPFEVLFTANLVGKDSEKTRSYSLEEVMEKALTSNLEIQISYKDIALSEQDIRSARSAIMPNLDFSISGVQSDPSGASNFQPERLANGQLTLDQVLYSEQAIAGVRVSHYLKNSQKYNTDALILEVLLDTYFGYFNVLSAKTDLLIRRENLDKSETNLELAKIRVSVGSESVADIYRWESEVANAKQDVVTAETSLMSAKLQLNNFLSNTLDEEYDVDDVSLDSDFYKELSNGPVSKYIKTTRDLALATEFMVEEAKRSNPNKQAIMEDTKAVKRQKLLNERLLYTPVVGLQGQAGYVFGRGGEGSSEVAGFEFTDYPWQVGISLSYPLFQGNSRRVNIQKSRIQLDQLNYSILFLDQNLELAVKTGVLEVLNASTNIAFSETSSRNSNLNFGLVQDNYKQGKVSVTQLIDAQQSALNAKLAYAISIYDFLKSQLQLEYSIGFFSMFSSAEEMNEFQERLNQYMGNND